MPNVDGNVYDAIVKEVENTADQELMDRTYSNLNNDEDVDVDE